jgi:hypothetical protein
LVRATFETRAADTLARIQMPVLRTDIRSVSSAGTPSFRVIIAPIGIADDWAVLTDGYIAVARGRDYHIDWIAPDNTVMTSGKMTFAWRRLSEEEKRFLADSARDSLNVAMATLRAAASSSARPSGNGMSGVSLVAGPPGTGSVPLTARIEAVPISEIPDYQPPFRRGEVMADADGHIWILPSTSAIGNRQGLVYDVIDRTAGLFRRVQLAPNRSIAGFGAGGIIYMVSKDSSGIWHLEKGHALLQ